MPLLELCDIEAGYGDVPILHGVSLTVEAGEVVSLVGANGAGKTTLLRAISHLLPLKGTVRFAGEDTRDLIRGTAQDGLDDAVDRGKTVIRRVRKNMGDAKDFVNEVADTAEGAYRDARNASS